jgi:hypothetical protein
MYKKDEASQLRQAFWTAFGQYISPHPSAEGGKANWVNYKTGIKHVYFRMQADNKKTSIGIEMTHPDVGIQELFYEQFTELKAILHETLGEEWEWELHSTDEHGNTISRIYKEIGPVNVFKQEDWPDIISFLKPRIIALDEFWSSAKYAFDELR